MTTPLPIRRRTALAAAAALPFAGARAQPAAPPPALHFFSDPAIGGAVLSPSGRHLAMRVRKPGERAVLAVLDLETMQPKPASGFSDADVGMIRWLNDDRLLFSSDVTWAGSRGSSGLFAVNRDGTRWRRISGGSDPGEANLRPGSHLIDTVGPQRDSWVYVAEPVGDTRDGVGEWRLVRINTDDGDKEFINTPRPAQDWLFDRQGRVLATWTASGGSETIHLRDGSGWRKLREHPRYVGAGIVPLHVGDDGTLYVSAREGSDLARLHTLDPKSGALAAKALLAVNGFDLRPRFVAADDGRVLGIRFDADAEVTQWWDPGLKALQAEVDKLLPATANRITPPRRGDSAYVLVASWSDQHPLRYFLLHRTTHKLSLVGQTRPDIDPKRMAQTDFVRFKARDGLEIPAYVTKPAGSSARRLPLVVLVHGGPWVRGTTWGFDPEVQFLASRGYAVVQPEFRGGDGFGWKHAEAGFKQWGGTMHDDLADAAHWAVAQGFADERRICVVGSSYGGYAATMALVRDPALFRCAASFAGPSDLSLLFDEQWSDTGRDFRGFGLVRLLGDPKTEADKLRAASPYHQAARLKNPLLLAYGRNDRRVNYEHAERMRSAVRPHNADLEYVVYLDEGHSLAKPENRVDYWTRVEKFLTRHIPASR